MIIRDFSTLFILLAGVMLSFVPYGKLWAYDPSFENAARATGGQYYNIKPSDLPPVTNMIVSQLHGQGTRTSLLNSKINLTEQQNQISVEVTKGVKHLTVSLAGLDQQVQTHLGLVRPSGTIVQQNDTGVTFTHLSSADEITIIWPESGTWQVTVSGIGTALLNVVGSSEDTEANIFSASFVVANNDIHGGYFPIPSVPPSKNQALYSVTMLQPLSDVQFSFIRAQDSTVIVTLDLRQNYPGASGEDYMGTVTVPTEPFRLEWSGHLKTGQALHYIYPKIYTPDTH